MTNSPMTCSEPLAKKVCSHEAMDVTPKAVKSNGTKQNGHSTPTKGGDDVPMADAVGDASNSDAETTPGRRGRPSRGSRSASRTTDEETDSRAPATRTSARLRSSRKWDLTKIWNKKNFYRVRVSREEVFSSNNFCHFSLPTDTYDNKTAIKKNETNKFPFSTNSKFTERTFSKYHYHQRLVNSYFYFHLWLIP